MKSGLKILLIALIMSTVSGCANMLGHNYYQAWQEHAYTIRAIQDSQKGYYSSYSSYVVAPANAYATNNPSMNYYSDSMQYAPNIYTNPNVQTPNHHHINDYAVVPPDAQAQYEYYAVDPTSAHRMTQPRVTAVNTHYPMVNQPVMNTLNPVVQPYVVTHPVQHQVQTYPTYTAAPNPSHD
ncbi:MAG: hypothetical protein ACWA5U_02565 [bacterium]